MRSMVAELASASSQELVEAAAAIVSELAVRQAPESGVAAMELAESLGRSIDLSEAALAVLVGRVEATGAHGEGGFPSAAAWLRNALGMRHGRAAERVTLARQLPRLARAGKLLAARVLSLGFASAICGAVQRLDDDEALMAEEILLGMVEGGLPVGQVIKAGDTITDLVAERQGKDTEPQESKRGFGRSWFSRSKSLDAGSWFKGWLNPEHTAIFDQIIGPLAKPRAQWDDRDLPQRTADALFSVISEGNKGAGLTLIIDLAAYATATGDTSLFDHTAGPNSGGTDVQKTPDAPDAAPKGTAEAGAASEAGAAPETEGNLETRAAPEAAAEAGTDTDTLTGDDSTTDADVGAGTGVDAHAEIDADEGFRARAHAGTGADADPGADADTQAAGTGTKTAAGTGTEVAAGTGTEAAAGTGTEAAAGANTETAAGTGTEASAGTGTETAAGANTETAVGTDTVMTEQFTGGPTPAGADRVPARLLDGTPISVADARRLALNAGVNALVLGRGGLPLYLGRTVRFATPAQRKTLLALYPTCCVHGCQIPAHLSEIHHLGGGWKLGVPTDIDELAVLCGWHNRWVENHRDRVLETRDDRGRAVLKILPPWHARRTNAMSRHRGTHQVGTRSRSQS